MFSRSLPEKTKMSHEGMCGVREWRSACMCMLHRPAESPHRPAVIALCAETQPSCTV